MRRRILQGLVLATAAVAALAGWGFLVEPKLLLTRKVSLACPGLRSGEVRALLFSDADFVGAGRREARIVAAAREFRPDLVLVAGDLLDRRETVADPATVRAAREFLASIPAGTARILVPGEEESAGLSGLGAAWGKDGPALLAGEARRFVIRGQAVDLFAADPVRDPAPWGLEREGGRTFVASNGRYLHQELVYRGDASSRFQDVEITLAFEALGPESYLDLRFAWQPARAPKSGGGWRIVRHAYTPALTLLPGFFAGGHRAVGRVDSGFVPPAGSWCRARIRIANEGARTRIRARFWPEGAEEPRLWSIDAVDEAASHAWRGTVAFGGRAGRRRFADLRVAALDGKVLLEERFDDRARFESEWRYPSKLRDWLRSPSAGARILLAHDPDIVRDVVLIGAERAPLVLSGHTHGGQVRIPGFGAVYTQTQIGASYDRGFFDYRGVPLFITAGVGTSTVPIRLFDPPEIVLLTLVPEK